MHADHMLYKNNSGRAKMTDLFSTLQIHSFLAFEYLIEQHRANHFHMV